MADEEGAICDECGSRIGPVGCCSSARGRELEIVAEQTRADAWKYRCEQLESALAAERAEKERMRERTIEEVRALLIEKAVDVPGEYDSTMTNDFNRAVDVDDINAVLNKIKESKPIWEK